MKDLPSFVYVVYLCGNFSTCASPNTQNNCAPIVAAKTHEDALYYREFYCKEWQLGNVDQQPEPTVLKIMCKDNCEGETLAQPDNDD